MRRIAAAGRDAADVAGGGVDAATIRILASALAGAPVDGRAVDTACTAVAGDPAGVARIDAMVAVATAHQDDADALDAAVRIAGIHAAVLRATDDRHRAVASAYELFASAVADVAAADGFDDACRRAADAMLGLSGFATAAVYVPGAEYARMVRAARDTSLALLADGEQDADGRRTFDTPSAIRVDSGLFADIVAGERPVFVCGREPIEALGGTGARSLVAVPMRDRIGRPVGLLLAIDRDQRELDLEVVESIRRLASVVAGELAAAASMRRSRAALGTLPELAAIAHADDVDVTAQLEALASIVARATDSDSAVVRVRDASGRFLETRAVVSRHGDAVADAIGTRTPLVSGTTSRVDVAARLRAAASAAELSSGSGRVAPSAPVRGDLEPAEVGDGEHELLLDDVPTSWSPAGQRVLRELSARTVASFPIDSRYGRHAVLYVIRTTARPFDDVDRACIRIVTAHAQHVVDRYVSQGQTARAIEAARSAVRLLGEALVAGVRTERTMRFVPRLFHEMFASSGVRAWRRDHAGALALVAGAGRMEATASVSDALLRAFERPLELELDTTRRPNVAAVSFDGFGGLRVGVEFELAGVRSLGVEEQRIVVDVAARIQEAMISAGRASAQQLQLDRMRALQELVASAHARLSEQHVVDTVLERLPETYGARAAAVFLVNDSGFLAHRGSIDLPAPVIRAIEATPSWRSDATGDDRVAVLAISRAGSDDRLGRPIRDAITEEGLADHAAIVVPITGREQTLGVMVLTFVGGLPVEFNEASASGLDGTLAAFGRHIGSALLNAREFERERAERQRTEVQLDVERENARQVRALHEVSRAFANSLSFDETLRAVTEAMTDRLDVDAVWIRQLDDRGMEMTLRAFHASHPELSDALERMVAAPEPREDPITVEVLQSRRAVLVTDPDDEQWARSELLRRLRPFLQRGSTLAVLPMLRPGNAADDVMGTLVLLSIDPAHALGYDKVDIAASVADQAALALDNARLYQQQKSFAEIIQESLLPRRLPDVPQIDFGVLYRSAVVGGDAPQIGGDFYDFLELEDGRLAMALGDVTGKGVQAAADTAMTKYVFRSLAREHPMPSSFLRHANDVVVDEITAGKFVTLFYAVIDPERHTLTCGLAGHPEPKILYPGGTELSDGTVVPEHEPRIDSITMEGLALGILADQDYEQRTYSFPPGAAIVVYTDGVVEARREGRLYGQFRLERRILEESDGGAGQIAYSIYEDCQAYAEHGLNDDVAIVVVRHMAEH